ncbi:MAG TPA: CYTH domain-containing protein [Tepidisphaeraceae bacterium]|jgi:CYTH domain-containing protein
MERERKFLVTQAPRGLRKHPHKRIRQGYLAIPDRHDDAPVEVRVRDEDGKHVLTVKGGRGASRTEVELPLPADAFRTLWQLTTGKRIEKVRYRIPHDGLTIELDVYGGKLRGLMTAEVEFESDGQLRRFRPPDWLGREVTGRDEFANNRLATRTGPPQLPKR